MNSTSTMASEEQEAVVAPSEEIPFKRIVLDPGGDTLIILQEKIKYVPLLFGLKVSSDNAGPLPEVHFLVSKKHLTLASRRAEKMFAGDFKEAIPNDTDGLCHWKFDPIFNTKAFEIVINTIHGKTRDVPKMATVELLAEIAVIVDDLECHEAIWFFAKEWIDQLKGLVPTQMCQDLSRWILISFVFKERDIFESSTRTAIKWSTCLMPTFNLPLRPKIVDQIQTMRENILGNLISSLYDLEKRLLNRELGCNFGCRSMLLGTLMQGLKACDLYPSQKPQQLPLLNIGSAIGGLQKLQWPMHFCEVQDSLFAYPTGLWSRAWHPNGSTGTAPKNLTQHKCGFEDIVKGLLSKSETEFQGLKLSDYS